MKRIVFWRFEVNGPWIGSTVDEDVYDLRTRLIRKYLTFEISRTSGIYVFAYKTENFWFAPWDQVNQTLCKSFPVTEADVPAEIKLKVMLMRE